mgnify:CR=1 FL=1
MNKSKRVLGSIFVTVLIGIAWTIYYTFNWKIYIPRSKEDNSLRFIVYFSHALTFMFAWCFIRILFSDPGRVPPYWGFYMGTSDTARRRYCLICHVFKPERCHHCSVCNRCVLNMDHHCPWINNCVGFHNRKLFILLLVYALANLYFTGIFMMPVIYEILNYLVTSVRRPELYPNLLIVGVFMLVCFLGFVLTIFARFHLSLVFENSTTIDNLEKSNLHQVYNLGRFRNWLQVFGKNPWYWALPVYGTSGKPVGDGVLWPQTYSHEEKREGYEVSSNRAQRIDSQNVLRLDLRLEETKKQSDYDTESSMINKSHFEEHSREVNDCKPN